MSTAPRPDKPAAPPIRRLLGRLKSGEVEPTSVVNALEADLAESWRKRRFSLSSAQSDGGSSPGSLGERSPRSGRLANYETSAETWQKRVYDASANRVSAKAEHWDDIDNFNINDFLHFDFVSFHRNSRVGGSSCFLSENLDFFKSELTQTSGKSVVDREPTMFGRNLRRVP